ncbi:lipid A deacylase LpxR family protein [Luteimonas huabeiensis]|uniref:lipid A deacylase LpxR family protein n=1 Tax=Luteimonas huabeiensis TaxID=1244513 RepID=UPI000464B87D
MGGGHRRRPQHRCRARAAPVAALLLAAGALWPASPLLAAEGCRARAAPLAARSTFNLRIDNDMFGGAGQDQGYTNGFLLSMVSPNLLDYLDDPCLPLLVRRLNGYLTRLQPEGFDEQNMTIGLGQMMYTPVDHARTDLIPDDRPYAGALMFSLGYNARRGDHLRTTQVRVGVVGPASQADAIQDGWHDLIGADRFQGWQHQLRDEPVFQLIHERRRRLRRQAGATGWGWDLTRHWGASLGNFATYANFGGELRLGLRLPDDFGTAPLRPAGENTAPVNATGDGRWNGHLFIAADARWVLRDITLDGNTFKSSHSVDKRPFVADLGYGLAVYRGHWRLAFARYHRTREFDGQGEVPVYGTITLGRRF